MDPLCATRQRQWSITLRAMRRQTPQPKEPLHPHPRLPRSVQADEGHPRTQHQQEPTRLHRWVLPWHPVANDPCAEEERHEGCQRQQKESSVADPMDNPLNQHLISVTDDDTKTRMQRSRLLLSQSHHHLKPCMRMRGKLIPRL